jgi:hypothetical protein
VVVGLGDCRAVLPLGLATPFAVGDRQRGTVVLRYVPCVQHGFVAAARAPLPFSVCSVSLSHWHLQTGQRITRLDDLQDIDELCVTEGSPPPLPHMAAAPNHNGGVGGGSAVLPSPTKNSRGVGAAGGGSMPPSAEFGAQNGDAPYYQGGLHVG